jgi:hypothetical protein
MVQTTTNPIYTYPIFDTFWNNAGTNGLSGLRLSLFNVSSLKPTEQQIDDAKINFKTWVDNFDPKLYNFIQIK